MAYTHAINGGWGYGGIAIAKNGLDGIFYIKSIMICVVLLVIFAVAVLCSKRVSFYSGGTLGYRPYLLFIRTR
jgi:uncharacterized membrane protein YtjA (UPF0391 family)